MFAALFVLIAVDSATYNKVITLKQGNTYTTIYESLGLPGYEGLNTIIYPLIDPSMKYLTIVE